MSTKKEQGWLLLAELAEATEAVAEAGVACSAHYHATGRSCGALLAALEAANKNLEEVQAKVDLLFGDD